MNKSKSMPRLDVAETMVKCIRSYKRKIATLRTSKDPSRRRKIHNLRIAISKCKSVAVALLESEARSLRLV